MTSFIKYSVLCNLKTEKRVIYTGPSDAEVSPEVSAERNKLFKILIRWEVGDFDENLEN
jgi:hypothetical protein